MGSKWAVKLVETTNDNERVTHRHFYTDDLDNNIEMIEAFIQIFGHELLDNEDYHIEIEYHRDNSRYELKELFA